MQNSACLPLNLCFYWNLWPIAQELVEGGEFTYSFGYNQGKRHTLHLSLHAAHSNEKMQRSKIDTCVDLAESILSELDINLKQL